MTTEFPLSLQIIPHLAPRALADVAVEAETLGYSCLWISDEGFMSDPFTTLGLIADRTSTIGLGIVTNPYTRHPAMTAAAIATLDHLSGGRAALCYVAGGSLVLDPLGMERPQPVATVSEAITLTRLLLTGDKVTWQGTRFRLNDAQLELPVRPDLPIHVAARGAKMLDMAARTADAVWTGADEDTLAHIRAAAGDRKLTLIYGDHPPSVSEMAGGLKQAVAQDGDADDTAPQSMAEWTAVVRQNMAQMEQLLIVTWEREARAMIEMLRAVKGEFA